MCQKILCFLLYVIFVFSGNGIAAEVKKDFPVDLVYLWVDGDDPVWKKKKQYWQGMYTDLPESGTDISRFREFDELKYSLRSVEKNMPWINRIYIITDNQTPKWLKKKHPKITIVDHKDILPSQALPTFNSVALEAKLPFIPNLSEHFLYANDDYYVRVPLEKEFFFDNKCNPKVYVKYKKQTYDTNLWLAQIKRAHELVAAKYPLSYVITPSHNMQAYRKSYFLDAINEFNSEFDLTYYSQFRRETDINRVLVDLLDNMKNRNTLISKLDTSQLPSNCKTAFSLISRDFDTMQEEKPCLFCLNDFEGKTDDEIKQTIEILEQHFPEKSSFEQ